MANYLIELLEGTIRLVPRLTLISPEEAEHVSGNLTRELRHALEAQAEGSEAWELINQHAESIVTLFEKANPPGAFVNAIRALQLTLSVKAMAIQEADPELCEMVRNHRQDRMEELEKEFQASLEPLRQGYTGPPIPGGEQPPVELVTGVTRSQAEFIFHPGSTLVNGFWTLGADTELESLHFCARHRGRTEAEADTAWKQLVVYAVVMYQGMVLCYRRGKVGAEPRLHAKLSIGVGGHMEPQDYEDRRGKVAAPEVNALMRELKEEVGILPGHINSAEFLGFVNTEEDAVGQVHIGLVFLVDLDNLAGCAFESALVEPLWLKPRSLLIDTSTGAQLEPWSREIAPVIYETLGRRFADAAMEATGGEGPTPLSEEEAGMNREVQLPDDGTRKAAEAETVPADGDDREVQPKAPETHPD
jgi:predicted NUDIX family phosphoesterase